MKQSFAWGLMEFALLALVFPASSQTARWGDARPGWRTVTNETDSLALGILGQTTNIWHAAITNDRASRASEDARVEGVASNLFAAESAARYAGDTNLAAVLEVTRTNLLQHYTELVASEAAARGTNVAAWGDALGTESRMTNAVTRTLATNALGVATNLQAAVARAQAAADLAGTGLVTRITSRDGRRIIDATGGVWNVTSITYTNARVCVEASLLTNMIGHLWGNRTAVGGGVYHYHYLTNLVSGSSSGYTSNLVYMSGSYKYDDEANEYTTLDPFGDDPLLLWYSGETIRLQAYSSLTVATTSLVDSVALRSDVPSTNGFVSKASADASYLSSTPGWFWQGSVQVTTNAFATNYIGVATLTNATQIALIPYTASRHDVTGAVELVSQTYMVGISFGMVLPDTVMFPVKPVQYDYERLSPTSYIVRAWCSADPIDNFSYYVGILTNLIAYGYDRGEMAPNSYTNDAAGIVSRVDDTDVESGSRSTVNAGTLVKYLNSRKSEIAQEAYNWTPSGRRNPNSNVFTLDEPLVQQGAVAYMNSGDYWCQSYQGGDWYSASTGSVWRIGSSGRVSLEIDSTNRMLNIIGFAVSGGYATIDISTNWVSGTPSIEFCSDLTNPQWLACPAQTMSYRTNYWRGVCPGVATQRFFRVVDPSGANVIKSHVRHEFLGGITIGTNTFYNLSELKAILNALP